jgi:hypothetical protein
MYEGHPEREFMCFRRSCLKVTRPYEAARFSTVPKNNEKDRPIAMEGLCNMVVQRRIGNGIRDLLGSEFDIDLDSLAAKHRQEIKNVANATIDLQNASDSVSVWLLRFLFPKWFCELILSARSPYLLGPDGHYHMLQKVSSMGAGYTFELMSLILLLLGRTIDTDFSVFGDDIITKNESAPRVLSCLEAVGFVVNEEKSFVNSKFRESCGANWHDDHGYVRSFDFVYPRTIHDCVVLYNKAFYLGHSYESFKELADQLRRSVPPALQGPNDLPWMGDDRAHLLGTSPNLAEFFRCPKPKGTARVSGKLAAAIRQLHLEPSKAFAFVGFKWKPRVASRTLRSLVMKRHTGKYFMYLLGGRLTHDTVEKQGTWQSVTWIRIGQRTFRAKALMASLE